MLRIVPSGWDPFGFVCRGVSLLPPGRDSTDPGAVADSECAGVEPTTAEDMLMRLSVMSHLQDVVSFIGSLLRFRDRVSRCSSSEESPS